MPDISEQQVSSPPRAPESKAGPFLEFDLSARVELGEKKIARIALTVMKAGAHIEEHKAVGRISVQTVSGHIRMQAPEKLVDLPAGRMLALDRAVPHDVEAIEDGAYLLTMAMPETSGAAKNS